MICGIMMPTNLKVSCHRLESTDVIQYKPETAYLLELLRCGLSQQHPSPLPENVKLECLLQLAKRHDVFLLAVQTMYDNGIIGDAEMGDWGTYRAQNLVKSFNQMDSLELLRHALNSEKVDFMVLKGGHIRALYPHPELREMADLDILVRPESMDTAGNILTANGFVLREKGENHFEYFKVPYTSVELHWELMSRDHAISRYFSDAWKRAVATGRGTEYCFSPEDELIFLIGHAAKHYFYYGTGIRSVLDIYVFQNAHPDLSIHKSYLQRELKKAGIAKFANNIMDLATVWFGNSEAELSAGALEMMDVIVSGSTYGLGGTHAKMAVKQMMEQGLSERQSKCKYLFSIIFPSRYTMQKMYPALKSAPFLLPFCWVARGLRTLLRRPRAIVREFTKVKDTKIL